MIKQTEIHFIFCLLVFPKLKEITSALCFERILWKTRALKSEQAVTVEWTAALSLAVKVQDIKKVDIYFQPQIRDVRKDQTDPKMVCFLKVKFF